MQFGILGPLRATHDGVDVPLGGPRQRAVLARLLLDAGRAVPAAALVDDVWSGRPPPTAAKTLQKYVSELRKVIGAPVLRTTPAGYVAEVADDDLDARRFERLVAAGDHDGALALWRGDVLADLPECDFAAPERARLGELRAAAVERRLEAQLGDGRASELVGELAELVEANPLRERLTVLLMQALYRSGRQVEALRAFERHRRRLADEVGVDPSPELRELEAAILRQDAALGPAGAPASRRRRGNLPIALTSFVGRGAELDAATGAVRGHRLVTLTGPGGVGKTRLALEAAGHLADGLDGGVWLVDLAPVPSPDLVARAAIGALSIDPQPAQPEIDTLVAALAHRPPLLLLLDNCEHLLPGAVDLAQRVLRSCPDVRVLATSRHPLGADGEQVVPVPELAEDEAVELFSERARLAAAPVDPDDHADAVVQICRRLDRLPLAIELAASQLRVLQPAQVAARLDDRLALLARSSGDPPRQRTLHDLVAWSYELLAPPTRRVFARLGVFASSFTLEAAEAVCAGGGVAQRDVLVHLTALVDHSLVARDDGTPATARYRLLETLRLFALDRLAEDGAVHDVARAHAAFFERSARVASRHFYGPGEEVYRARLEAEDANLRVALTWSREHDLDLAARLAVALWQYWGLRWMEREAVPYLASLLEAGTDLPAPLRAWVLAAAAELAANPGDARHAVRWGEEAVATFTRLGDAAGLAAAQVALGSALGNQGAFDRAEAALQAALASAEERGDVVLNARARTYLGFVVSRRGHHERARELHEGELAMWRQLGSLRGEATSLRRLAASVRYAGALDEAEALCRRALDIWVGLGDPASIAHVRMTLADVARARGDLDEAVALSGQALETLATVGDRRCMASANKNLGLIALARGQAPSAVPLFVNGLRLRHELGDDAGLAECLEGMASACAHDGRHEEAVVLAAAATARRDASGFERPVDETVQLDAVLAEARAAVGDEGYDAVWADGAALSADDAVARAVALTSSPAPRTSPARRA